MKRTILWTVAIILGVIVLFVLPGLLGFGCCGSYATMGSYGRSYGMMGGWWTPLMFLAWLIPIGILVLTIAGGVWLGNVLSNRGNAWKPPVVTSVCRSCGKPVASDWKVCPYCGTDLDRSDSTN